MWILIQIFWLIFENTNTDIYCTENIYKKKYMYIKACKYLIFYIFKKKHMLNTAHTWHNLKYYYSIKKYFTNKKVYIFWKNICLTIWMQIYLVLGKYE